MDLARQHVAYILSRRNAYSGLLYKNDPAVFGRELANAPLAMGKQPEYASWAKETAAFVKSLDKNHLLAIGSAGTGVRQAVEKVYWSPEHADPNIDFATAQVWPAAYGWEGDDAAGSAASYVASHVGAAAKLDKPLVLTAFSFRRDKPAPPAGAEPLPAYTTPAGSVFARDAFYGTLLETARAQIKKKNHGALAGTIAWAWSGEEAARRRVELEDGRRLYG